MEEPGAGRRLRRRRAAALLLLASGWLFACAHAQDAGKQPRCPDSETAMQCSSGGWSCMQDDKRGCELCTCEHTVI